MKKTATLIKDYTESPVADQRVYRLMPPHVEKDYHGVEHTYDVVIVSAADVPFSGPETYIFPGTADGEVTDYGELEGSYRGGLDHEEALRGMGYEVFTGDVIQGEIVGEEIES
ncbi:hypothetical protein SEA_LUCKYBARNES_54 [Brevibacterium phage LuckyBarnes]|uniref:Uncharacterized protein n=1 Tax=Brevibacterium phage LuckyBarnes TaxID=2027888 RepID=A0A249XNQ9_9CAUD|nr:hypothetical protein HOS02_gp54 [Brevibacterium phage LuckyBarnes]ASZ73371.1 hypothetical protein SEA_LUCKYBARNES_54 [Brevibacterium phage LuckyBarnes]